MPPFDAITLPLFSFSPLADDAIAAIFSHYATYAIIFITLTLNADYFSH
jgi:hypothetical protein